MDPRGSPSPALRRVRRSASTARRSDRDANRPGKRPGHAGAAGNQEHRHQKQTHRVAHGGDASLLHPEAQLGLADGLATGEPLAVGEGVGAVVTNGTGLGVAVGEAVGLRLPEGRAMVGNDGPGEFAVIGNSDRRANS